MPRKYQITLIAGVSKEGKPSVLVEVGGQIVARLSPEEARTHSFNALLIAENADQAAMFVRFFMGKNDCSFAEAERALVEFRRYRIASDMPKANKKPF